MQKKQRLIVYRVKIRDAIPKSLFNQSLRLIKGRKINPIVENNKFKNFLCRITEHRMTYQHYNSTLTILTLYEDCGASTVTVVPAVL